jgi:hypothetical protein
MPRLDLVDPEEVTGTVAEALAEYAARRGEIGPMIRAMANSSALHAGTWTSRAR